jgi:superfamily II DNA or RNA helicase
LTDLELVALRLMRHVAPEMLLIDEAHNLLATSYREQRAMLNLIRSTR